MSTTEQPAAQPEATKKEPEVKDVDSGDEDMPELENAPQQPAAAGGAAEAGGAGGKQTRSEKKSRKAMQKLGMKPVPGIIRVTVKKAKNVMT